MGEFHWTDIPVGVAYGWSLILQAWIVFRLGRWPALAERVRRSNG